MKILYRGPLSSCNYACRYCPFAKAKESRESLKRDKQALSRFVEWVRGQTVEPIGILFTPWGEALIRRWYQKAIIDLSLMAHVKKVAIQTNLSCRLDWLEGCDKSKVALWTTFHPSFVARSRFMAQCQTLDQQGIVYSVGMVGLKEHINEIALLRRELRPEVYLWLNAYQEIQDYYTQAEREYLKSIDPLFNATPHQSKGRRCQTGETVVTIDGDGDVRRCHFVKELIGNIYSGDMVLKPRLCPNQFCDCHIGYVHLDDLGLYEVFGEGLLERQLRCKVRLALLKKNHDS